MASSMERGGQADSFQAPCAALLRGRAPRPSAHLILLLRQKLRGGRVCPVLHFITSEFRSQEMIPVPVQCLGTPALGVFGGSPSYRPYCLEV